MMEKTIVVNVVTKAKSVPNEFARRERLRVWRLACPKLSTHSLAEFATGGVMVGKRRHRLAKHRLDLFYSTNGDYQN